MLETTLISKTQLDKSIWEFRFAKPDTFEYLAGQAAKLSLPRISDERGVARWFSLASAPHEPDIRFITRVGDDSSDYKRALKVLTIGAEAYLEPPMGSFTFPLRPKYPIVCIASGVGIAPFRSLLLANSKAKNPHSTKLVLRTRATASVPYEDELRALVATTFIDNTDSRSSQGFIEELHAYQRTELHLYYIAGTQAFVDRIEHALRANGLPEHHIITDPYHGYETIPTAN